MPLLTEDGEGSPDCGTSGIRRGTRKRDSEREPSLMSPVRASATDTLLSVALENHLNPSNWYAGHILSPESSVGIAIVSVRDTSDPPGR